MVDWVIYILTWMEYKAEAEQAFAQFDRPNQRARYFVLPASGANTFDLVGFLVVVAVDVFKF